jgi:hypothetical protein
LISIAIWRSLSGMDYVDLAGYSVAADVLAVVEGVARGHGIPRNVLLAIVLAESAGDPGAVGDGGRSFGLLQLFTAGGQGDGHAPTDLMRAGYNLSVGTPHIARAWKANRHLSGDARMVRTAAESGHPRDPLTIEHGPLRESVERSIERIVSIYRALEAEAPSAEASPRGLGDASRAALDASGAVVRGVAWIRDHPALAIGGAATLAVLLLV